MDEGRLVRMRGTELIGEADRERLARQARDPARVPARAGTGRTRALMLAAARWWRGGQVAGRTR